MHARQLNCLLFAAEAADIDQKDAVLFADSCGLEPNADLLGFLSYLTDPLKPPRGFASACAQVYNNKRLPLFWRALAALERGRRTKRSRGWPRTPDAYFAQALAIISPAWNEPPEDLKGLSEADTTAAKARNTAKKDVVTPEALYIYHGRLLARSQRLGARYETGMIVLGAADGIREGWFHAPAWTELACDRLTESGDHERARKLLTTLAERDLKNLCYFSRAQRARLMERHGALLAA